MSIVVAQRANVQGYFGRIPAEGSTSAWSAYHAEKRGDPIFAHHTMRAGRSVINLRHAPQGSGNRWARVILRVRGVDALYEHLRAQGLNPSTPKNADWGERYFEISDPEGDVISFAELLDAIH